MSGTGADRPLPPRSVEAEMALLGSLILAGAENHENAAEAMSMIRDSMDFYLPRHQVVYQAVRECWAKHGRIDSVLLVERLRESRKLEELRRGSQEPAAFLQQLAECVPVGTNAPYYARIVRERAQARRLIAWAESIQRRAEQLEESPMKIAEAAIRALEKATGQVNGHSSARAPEGTPASKGAGGSSTVESKAARHPVSR